MKKYDILDDPTALKLRILASTKAGLVSAALQGVFAATQPEEPDETAEEARFPFELQASGFPALLISLLNEGLAVGQAEGVILEDVALSLITDQEIKGEFVGRPTAGFGQAIRAVSQQDVEVAKNVVNNWETTLTLET